MPLDKKYLEILKRDNLNDKDYILLEELAQTLRKRILEVVSKNGGLLNSCLGGVVLLRDIH